MEDLQHVIILIEEAEKFKETDKYKDMTPEIRDFFNEELGRFKLLVELNTPKDSNK